jgi:hypothetical protein
MQDIMMCFEMLTTLVAGCEEETATCVVMTVRNCLD